MRLTLRHVGGEVRVFDVDYVAPNGSYLAIRWGLSGFYDYNLKSDALTARSAKARLRGPALWHALDRQKVYDDVSAYLQAKRGNPEGQVRATMQKHAESMPLSDGPVSND